VALQNLGLRWSPRQAASAALAGDEVAGRVSGAPGRRIVSRMMHSYRQLMVAAAIAMTPRIQTDRHSQRADRRMAASITEI